MKRYVFIIAGLAAILALPGCDPSPQNLVQKAAQNMAVQKSYTVDAKANLTLSLLGMQTGSISMNNVQQIENDSGDRKIISDVTVSGLGNQPTEMKMYLSKNMIGKVDPQTGTWQMHVFNPNDPSDAQTQAVIKALLSLYDPESELNLLANSATDSSFTSVGDKTIDGVRCEGIEVHEQMKEYVGNLMDVLDAAGVDGIGNDYKMASELAQNTNITYWIGISDGLVHASELSNDMGVLKINVTGHMYDFGKPIPLPH